MTVGAVVIALPLGIITAIYLGELAPQWLREILKPIIEVLAGIPSIVLGFLGWVALAPLVQALGAPTGLTAFTGSLILAYMSLPTIISIAEDALYAVPKEYRDGSLAIGATQWQTIWRVVVPAARSGMLIAVMLGIGRAIGETMVVMMVTGNAANIPPLGPGMFFQPVRTMTATIAAEMGEVAQGTLHYNVLFGIGIVLFVITFAINSLANRLIGFDGSSRARGRQAMKRQQTHRLAVALFTAVAFVVVIPIIMVILYVFWLGLPALTWDLSDPAALQWDDRRRHHAGHRRHAHAHHRHGHRLHAVGDRRRHLPGRVRQG